MRNWEKIARIARMARIARKNTTLTLGAATCRRTICCLRNTHHIHATNFPPTSNLVVQNSVRFALPKSAFAGKQIRRQENTIVRSQCREYNPQSTDRMGFEVQPFLPDHARIIMTMISESGLEDGITMSRSIPNCVARGLQDSTLPNPWQSEPPPVIVSLSWHPAPLLFPECA